MICKLIFVVKQYTLFLMDISLIRENEPTSKHSTFRVGGCAKYFFEAGSAEDLEDALKWAKDQDLPHIVLGGGSNVLFQDSGFPGLIVKFLASEVHVEGDCVIADAGAKMSQVARHGGLEEWAYLPGTVGGAVCGNAGCFGLEVKDVLTRAWILGKGEVGPEYFDFQYRHSSLKDSGEILLKAAFKVQGDFDEKKIEKFSAEKQDKQPPGMSGGSFFKNPEGQSAGELIDKCGLKGKTVGGAQISEKHANFILNTGNATASDILELADIAKKAVKEQFNIDLEEEIRIIG